MAVPGDQDRTTQHLSRALRLHTPAEFRNVFDQPEVVRDTVFRILHKPNGRDHCRLGLVVSRKVCRSAVGRNRLKRLIRESFRAHQRELASRGACDIVVLPTPQAATTCNAELSARLVVLWHKMRARDPAVADMQNRNMH